MRDGFQRLDLLINVCLVWGCSKHYERHSSDFYYDVDSFLSNPEDGFNYNTENAEVTKDNGAARNVVNICAIGNGSLLSWRSRWYY